MENLPGTIGNDAALASPARNSTRRAMTLGGPGNSHKKRSVLNRLLRRSRKVAQEPANIRVVTNTSSNSGSNNYSNIKLGNDPNLNAQLAAYLEEGSAPTGGPGGPAPPKKSLLSRIFSRNNNTKKERLPNGMANLIKSRAVYSANSNNLLESYNMFIGKCIQIIRHLQSGANQHYVDKPAFDVYWAKLKAELRNFDATKSAKATAFVNEINAIHRNINDLLSHPIRKDKKLAADLQKLSLEIKALSALHILGDRLKELKKGGKRAEGGRASTRRLLRSAHRKGSRSARRRHRSKRT